MFSMIALLVYGIALLAKELFGKKRRSILTSI